MSQTTKDEFLDLVRQNIHRDGIEDLIEYLDSNGFFESPASTKYHGDYKGGLCRHSLNVYYDLIDELRSLFGSNWSDIYSVETATIVALFHDVCKIDKYIEVEKNVKDSETGAWSLKKVFDYNSNQTRLGHASSSVYKIMDYIKLTDIEKQAIHWHMGAFDISPYNSNWDMGNAFENNTLAFALHIADMTATYIDENSKFTELAFPGGAQ